MEKKNFKQYCEDLEYPKIRLFREIRKRTGISIVQITNWSKFDSTTKNPKYLAILSEMTGIEEVDLFREEDN